MKTTFNKILNMSLVLITLIVFGGKAWGAYSTAPAGTYNLVTDASTLSAGDVIIIAGTNNSTTKAISTTQNNNNRGTVEVTLSNNSITLAANNTVQGITLEAGSSSGTFSFNTGDGYLCAASSNSNYLRTEAAKSANSSWTISISSNLATVTAQGSYTRCLMRYNYSNNPPIYACYATNTSTGVAVNIYKKAASGFTVDFAVNTAGYGTVSPSNQLTNIASGTVITKGTGTNVNQVTVNGTTVTATPHAQDADYNYAFSNWSVTDNLTTVTKNITITANFTRTERALTNYRTKCCSPLGSINGSVLGTTTSGVTLQWNDIANVTGWTVTGVDDQDNAVVAGNIAAPTDEGDTYNCVVSNLTSGKTYTFTITPTHTADYCSVYEDNIVEVTIPLAQSTVTFNANGATDGSVPNNITQNTGTTVDVPDNTGNLVKTHYVFDGWNTLANGQGDDYSVGDDFTLSGNWTLYAKWACAEYVNVSKGTPSNGSFSIPALQTGSQYTCDDAVVVNVTDITPASGYRFKEITQTGVDANDVTINQASKTVTYAQYANGSSTINVTFEQIPVYTITWSVNGLTSTTNVTDGSPLVLPTPAPTTDGCDDGKTFVGWTATAIANSTDTKPGDLFTTVGGAPAINADKTFYAVFATSNVTPGSTATILSEPFTGFSNNEYVTAPGSSATKLAGSNMSYTCNPNSNNGTRIQTSGGPSEGNNVLIKSGGSFTVSSIPTNGQTTASLSYKWRGSGTLTPSGSSGISIGSITTNTDASNNRSCSATITINSGSTYNLIFSASSDNVRFDDLTITSTTADVVNESGYITSCTKQVAVTATDGGTATIDGGSYVAWVDDATKMELVATPAEGYVFAGWTSTGADATFGDASAATTTVKTEGAATITANFVAGSTISADKESLNLVTYVNEGGSTTVTFTSSDAPQYGTVQYTIEDDTYISVSPASTYLSTSNLNATVTVSYGDDEAGSYNTNLVATAYNSKSVVVGTKVIPITLTIKPKFTVTAQADVAAHATAISATPNADVKDGTTVTLSQTAADGWIFQKWTISYTLNAVAHNEDLDGNTFTMPAANVTATAVYAEETGEYLDAPTNAAAGSLTSHSAVLSWDAVEHVSSYSVYVVGTDFEETFDGITETSYTVTGLKAETEYMWSVTAIGDGVNYYTSSAADGEDFTTTARILSSIAIKTNASKMTYNEGETFDKTGLEVTATYDDETTATIGAAKLVVTDEPLEVGTIYITVSYTESGVTKEATLEGITITELYVVTWKVNNAPYGDPTYTTGAIGDLPANPSSACSSKYPYFVKWVIGDDPTADAVTPSTVIDGSVTINAVFAKTKTKTGYSSTPATAIVAGGEYIMGAQQLSDNTTMWYFSSYSSTDEDLSWGPMNTNTANAIVLTASGTTSSFQLKDGSNNYVSESETVKKFRMSSTTADLSMTDAGAIKSTTSTWLLRHNYNSGSGGLRWYDGTTGVAVYLYAAEYSYSNLTILCPATYTAAAANVISNGSVGLKLQAEDDAETSISDLEANATVLLVATPDEGYEFKSWTVMQGESDITESNVAGNVLTMPAGDVTISASFNKIAVESVTINGEANVQINNDVVWTLDITPNTARPTVVWSTANDAVATVSNGTVHGVAVGSTTITATVDGIPYDKTINVIRETKLNSLTVVDPKTAYTLNEAFVAPQVNANYVYVDDESVAPTIEDVAAEFTGFNNQTAEDQTITVSYGGKSTTYDITVSPWTLKLQTKRMYGNDEIKEDVANVEVASLASPVDLTAHYVSGLCTGYEQIGYITSSADVDALPNDLLTSYTPSANNETLYGVFQKVNYAGETYVDEDFSSATGSTEIDTDNYDWLNAESKVYNDSKMLKLGSKKNSGSMTTNTFDLSHDFVVKLKAKQYASDEKSIQVTVGSTTNSETSLTSSMVEYTFNFNAATSTSQVVITSPKRAYVESIKIYTLSDIAYMSVYDCREEKDVEYVIGNDKVVWTACENTTVMEGQSYTLCANEPSLQGYDFGGWIINGDEENVKAKGTTIEVAEDLTITPKFTETSYGYQYALAATATNGTIASVTVNGVDKALNEVALHDGDAVVVTAVPNTNYELSEWTHSENVSLTTDANTASFTVAVGAGDMTIAAIFVEKAQYTMTLNVFGRTYTTKQGHEGDTYSSVLDNAQSPALTGYSFQGWSTDAENANAIISGEELLTADVTLYAIVGSLQPTGYVYNKVTSMEDVTADGYYLIVNESANKAFDGSRDSSSDLDANNNYVTVSVSENKIISNAEIDAAVVTILAVPETDPQKHYIKTATGYYIGNGGSNGLLANKTTDYRNTLSFSEGNFVVNSGAKQDNKDMVLMFNNNNNRFGYYKGTQQDIQLYKRGEVHSEIIPEAEPVIEISTEVSASTSFPGGYVGDVTVVNGGSLNADINLSVGDLIIHSTLGKGTGTGNGSGNNPGSCGQIVNGNNITVTGDVYLELELTQDAKASAGWYAFSVPFPVDAMNGVYYGDTKLTNEVGYAIMSHYGELRAKDEYAWKKFRGIMQPGVFYVITVGNTDYKTLRFKKVKDEALVASTSVAVSPFPSQTGNNADGAWNGIGNPNLAISNLSTAVTLMQFYDHKTNTFIGRSHSVNLVVGSAFFIQYNATTSVSIPVGTTSNSGYLAPARTPKAIEEMIFEAQLNDENGHEADNVFLTAREDATNEYEIGHDVAKMSMGAAKCAQMWVPAYGTQLCAADFPLVNDKATYPLTINAPSAGTYTISTTANENATLYLTKNGRIYWNLTMGACELDLNQGQNNEYGLVLRAEVPAVTTGVENGELLNGENGVQKVVIDEHVYILRGGEMYDMTGKMVK